MASKKTAPLTHKIGAVPRRTSFETQEKGKAPDSNKKAVLTSNAHAFSKLESGTASSKKATVPVQSTKLKARKEPTKPKSYSSGPKDGIQTNNNNSKASKSEKEKPSYSKEEEHKFDLMIAGNLKGLPPMPKSSVRIFLSSTFSDSRAERNALAKIVYPLLKDFCASKDLDFAVVDLRWGLTEDSQNDHSVEKICLQEVKNCQKMSIGPNFVVLMGSRYGFRPIPIEIDAAEYNIIYQELVRMKEDVSLLDQWYIKDENNIPALYKLQPIRSKFKYFGDFSPGYDDKRASDTSDWSKTLESLQEVLRKGAKSAAEKSIISKEKCHEYYLSVTECEIREGILQAEHPDKHCMFFHRMMDGLNNFALGDKNAARYIDTVMNGDKVEVNTEVQELMKSLRSEVKKKIFNEEFHEYTLPWKPGGVDPTVCSEHEVYVYKFCEQFITSTKKMICDGLQDLMKPGIRTTEYYSDFNEILHHLIFCNKKCQSFCGQESVLQSANDYILNDKSRKPLIIHAESGCGKTSVMAMIMKKLNMWIKDDFTAVIRFIGTSPNSSNIYDVLFGICGQLADDGDLILEPMGYKNFKSLATYFPRFLRRVSSVLKKTVVVLLDSIDQLSDTNNPFTMTWLPDMLPSNLRLIISTLPKEKDILHNTKNIVKDDNNYLEVPRIPLSTGNKIISTYLKQKQRNLTSDQTKLLMNRIETTPSPLFLKLLLDESLKWSSHTPLIDIHLATTVQDAITHLFESMEMKFGKTLFASAAGLVTVGLNGLSEIEIEDALSCDDRALDDVYRYHDPPVEGIVRIPPVLWARIFYDLKEYLAERLSFGKTTLFWYHRQFFEAAQKRFANGQSASQLHQVLVEVYSAEKGIKRDITLTRRNKTIVNADRQVTHQPIVSKNQRTLECLTFHLCHSQTTDDNRTFAKQLTYCNFRFLTTKISSFSVSHCIEDINSFLLSTKDEELNILVNFLQTYEMQLNSQSRFAVLVLACFRKSTEYKHISNLVQQCQKFLNDSTQTSLIPSYPCLFPDRNKDLELQTFEGYSEKYSVSDNYLLLEKLQNAEETDKTVVEFTVFNVISESSLNFQIRKPFSGILPHLGNDRKSVYFVTEDTLCIFSLEDEKVTAEYKFTTKEGIKPVCFDVAEHLALAVVLLSNNSLAFLSLDTRNLLTYCTAEEKVSCLHNVVLLGNGKAIFTGTFEEGGSGFISCCSSASEHINICYSLDGVLYWDFMHIHQDSLVTIAITVKDNMFNLIAIDITSSNTLYSVEIQKPSKLFVSPDATQVVVVTEQGKVLMHHYQTGRVLREYAVGTDVFSADVSWDNKLLCILTNIGVLVLELMEDKIDIKTKYSQEKFLKLSFVRQFIVVLDAQGNIYLKLPNSFYASSLNECQPSHTSDFKHLSNEDNVTAVDVSVSGHDVITTTADKFLHVWSLETGELVKSHQIQLRGDVLKCANDSITAILDRTNKHLTILDYVTGHELLQESWHEVLDITLSHDLNSCYFISKVDNYLQVEIIDLKKQCMKKSIKLQKGLKYQSIEILSTLTERYLVLKCECAAEDRKSIEASWKSGGFPPQPHPYRFAAVDLTQSTGAIIHCYRQLSKIPCLGNTITYFKGNSMIIAIRSMAIFWDIPTGKCDQLVSCVNRGMGMMYRPHWTGKKDKELEPDTVYCLSENGKYLAGGSYTGFVVVYETSGGLAVGKRSPTTKHNAEILHAVISRNNQWLATGCHKNVLKLWKVEAGIEEFSIHLDSVINKIKFSSESDYVIVLTGGMSGRVAIFKIHAHG